MKDIFSESKKIYIYLTTMHYSPVLPVSRHSIKSTFEVRCIWGRSTFTLHSQSTNHRVSFEGCVILVVSVYLHLAAYQRDRFAKLQNAVVWLAETFLEDSKVCDLLIGEAFLHQSIGVRYVQIFTQNNGIITHSVNLCQSVTFPRYKRLTKQSIHKSIHRCCHCWWRHAWESMTSQSCHS